MSTLVGGCCTLNLTIKARVSSTLQVTITWLAMSLYRGHSLVQVNVSAMTPLCLLRPGTSHGQDSLDLLGLLEDLTTGRYKVVVVYNGTTIQCCRTLLCKVEPEWQKATHRFEREHIATFDHQNDAYETIPAPWQPTLAVNTSVSHQFGLQIAQNMPGVTMVGTLFFIPTKEPISFEVKGTGPDITTGEPFAVAINTCILYCRKGVPPSAGKPILFRNRNRSFQGI